MAHTSPLSQPAGLVLLVYLATVPAAVLVGVALAVGRNRPMAALRRPAAKLAVGIHVGVGTLVATGLPLGTLGSVGGLLLAVPLVGVSAIGAGLLHRRHGLPVADAVLYGTLGSLLGLPLALVAAGFVWPTWRTDPVVDQLRVALAVVVAAGGPLVVVHAVGGWLAGAYEPLATQRQVLAAGVTLGLVALPLAAFLYPQVPVGVEPPSAPDRPETLTNESVASYVAETEYVRFHRGSGGSGGCSAEVVSRRTAARYLAAASLPAGADEADDLREATAEQLEDLPTGGYYAVTNCAAAVPLGGVVFPGHGDAFWHAVYHVTDDETERLGEGRTPPSTPTPTPED